MHMEGNTSFSLVTFIELGKLHLNLELPETQKEQVIKNVLKRLMEEKNWINKDGDSYVFTHLSPDF